MHHREVGRVSSIYSKDLICLFYVVERMDHVILRNSHRRRSYYLLRVSGLRVNDMDYRILDLLDVDLEDLWWRSAYCIDCVSSNLVRPFKIDWLLELQGY